MKSKELKQLAARHEIDSRGLSKTDLVRAIQPVLQRINHPGGDASRAAALIFGARVEMAF